MGIWDKFYERAKSFFADDGHRETKSRCYYDLLEVSREANEDEIKRSFKRLALKWHPDKNPDRTEECTAYFVLIQQAYEVLIDPQERAFYDRHRENIIHRRSGAEDGAGPNERRDTGIGLDPFMNTSCFRGGIFASDEERQEKFYAVYRDLFHKLAAEEYDYIEDPEERNFPVFGKATSDYDTVVAPFYAFWLDFSTRRSFAWLDKWDLREAPDRPSARAMEKENRKLRELGRKKRSEEVRRLAEFVRKHDKRVEEAKKRQRERNAQMQQITEEQRRQVIRRNLEKLEAHEIDEEAHKQHLAHLEEIERALDSEFGIDVEGEGGQSGEDDEEAEGIDGNQLRCIICEKTFKSRQVLINHQRSKKHRQMVEMLRAHMRDEDQLLFEEGNGSAAEDEQVEEPQRRGKRRKKKGKKNMEEKGEEDQMEEGGRETVEKGKEEEEAEQSGGKENEPKGSSRIEPEKGGTKQQQSGNKKPSETATTKGSSNNKKQKGGQQKQPTGPVTSECMTCGEEFESKTKLHAHLRDTGHAALKTTAASAPKTMVFKKKEKGRKGGARGVKNEEEC